MKFLAKRKLKTYNAAEAQALIGNLTVSNLSKYLEMMTYKSMVIENAKDFSVTIKVPEKAIFVIKNNLDLRKPIYVKFIYRTIRWYECLFKKHQFKKIN